VAILVYDLTKEDSFKSIESWLEEIRNNCDNPNLGLVLVGNKSDLTELRVITEEAGQDFADKHDLMYFETSAKANSFVDDIFVQAAEHFYQKFQNGLVDITSDSQGLTLGPQQLSKGKCSC
jgi:GTPase SAR1 family protein